MEGTPRVLAVSEVDQAAHRAAESHEATEEAVCREEIRKPRSPTENIRSLSSGPVWAHLCSPRGLGYP